MKILKYPLTTEPVQTIKLPVGALILTVQPQSGVVTLWVQVDPDAPTEDRTIRTYATGDDLDKHAGTYIGTCLVAGGHLVWHVFDVTPAVPNDDL